MAGKDTFLPYYREYRDKIYTYFLYRVNFNKETAEDLTSDVFLKAFDAFETFDENRSFQAWIYTIARNHLVNFYGKNARHKTVALDEVRETLLDEAFTGSERVERKLECDRLMARIKTLPEDHQEYIILRYINELSYKEMAEILNKEEGALRVAVSRVIAALRESYE